MKISDNASFRSIFTPELKELVNIFKRHNYELRIAGGAVRDILMNINPQDIDFATVATPTEMKEMFNNEGIRMLNMKGEAHGTITVRINEKQNFEVTTLRIDVLTDGRRAEVEFTKDWQLDANRRDLTINSLFLGLEGTVYDYFHGIDDLEKRRVVFVGDAPERIQEDYLRILRYFRFFGRISVYPDNHDAETLTAIRENMEGLKNVSGERISTELRKILVGNHKKEIVSRMIDLGISPFIGLPMKANIEEFHLVCDRASQYETNPFTLLVALLRNKEAVADLNERLHLSNYERDLCYFINEHRSIVMEIEDPVKLFQLMICDSKTRVKVSDLKEFVCELFKYLDEKDHLETFKEWNIPKFPVSGYTLINIGLEKGPKVAKVLGPLKKAWVESNFTLTEDELIKIVPSLLENLDKK